MALMISSELNATDALATVCCFAISLAVVTSAIANGRARFSAAHREHARNISRQLSQLRQLATSISIRVKPVGAEALDVTHVWLRAASGVP
jgi:hypothetical protein